VRGALRTPVHAALHTRTRLCCSHARAGRQEPADRVRRRGPGQGRGHRAHRPLREPGARARVRPGLARSGDPHDLPLQGQCCVAGGRIFVQEAVHDAFVAKVRAFDDGGGGGKVRGSRARACVCVGGGLSQHTHSHAPPRALRSAWPAPRRAPSATRGPARCRGPRSTPCSSRRCGAPGGGASDRQEGRLGRCNKPHTPLPPAHPRPPPCRSWATWSRAWRRGRVWECGGGGTGARLLHPAHGPERRHGRHGRGARGDLRARAGAFDDGGGGGSLVLPSPPPPPAPPAAVHPLVQDARGGDPARQRQRVRARCRHRAQTCDRAFTTAHALQARSTMGGRGGGGASRPRSRARLLHRRARSGSTRTTTSTPRRPTAASSSRATAAASTARTGCAPYPESKTVTVALPYKNS